MEPIVRFDNVTKRFGALTVLDQLNLEVAKGEIISIIGPSGSGKTTVLRVLMTLEKVDDGIIYVNNQPLTHMQVKDKMVPASERHMSKVRGLVGMVFQNFNLFPHFTALRNCIEGQVRVLKRSKTEAEKHSLKLLKMVNLDDKIHHYPGQLSGGQQQRVAIARALSMHPKVMLFDEVTSALDPEMVGEVLNVIRRLVDEHSLTMIIVTHEMGFAKEISDRICFFDEGQIMVEGPPDQFFDSIQNERLKDFLGAVLET